MPRIGISTAYRHPHEGIDVLAAQAPDLHAVLGRARREGWSHISLDGTLIETDRVRAKGENSHDLWYSGKHKLHGGNIQVLTEPGGFPVWTAPVEPGSTHDITAARAHVLPTLYPAAAAGLPTLTDKGYTGAGIGIQVPVKGRHLAPDTAIRNQLINALRAPGERGNAILKPDGPPCNASAYAPGESATSPPQPSSSQPSNEAATEKTSTCPFPAVPGRVFGLGPVSPLRPGARPPPLRPPRRQAARPEMPGCPAVPHPPRTG